jgi:S1-C subfamily serine protease
METNLLALSQELEQAVDRAAAFVVAVHGRRRMSSSGFLWRDGVVVTSEHAIQRDEDIRVTLADGRTVEATLAGRDPGTDIAVLRVTGGAPASVAAAAGPLKPGRLVLSLGRSRDSGVNASMGILSAVSGAWRSWRGGALDGYIRLDLTLFPASTGGPVLTTAGEFVGVASPVLSRIAPLAIPASTVERVASDLLAKGRVARGYLGVGLQPVPLPEHLKQNLGYEAKSAVIVLSVEPESPAERAGILIGDVLLSMGGKPLRNVEDLQAALEATAIGQQTTVKLVRGGKASELQVTVGERGA